MNYKANGYHVIDWFLERVNAKNIGNTCDPVLYLKNGSFLEAKTYTESFSKRANESATIENVINQINQDISLNNYTSYVVREDFIVDYFPPTEHGHVTKIYGRLILGDFVESNIKGFGHYPG